MSYSFVSTNPLNNIEACCPIMYETEAVALNYNIEQYSKHFTPSYFNDATNSFHFEANSDVKFIQLFNKLNELQFNLPITSNKIRLNKNLFNPGENRLSFVFNNNESLDIYVTIKNDFESLDKELPTID